MRELPLTLAKTKTKGFSELAKKAERRKIVGFVFFEISLYIPITLGLTYALPIQLL